MTCAGGDPPGGTDLREFRRAGRPPGRHPRLNAAAPAARSNVTLQDGGNRTATGSLAVIDNTVDATTGTIHLKATFDNRDGMLWPGQFVNVALTLDTVRDATVVPTEGHTGGPQGQVVFVVKPGNTVEIRPVTTGFSRVTRR
jgi:multidrug efflux system membrane fusion protein